MAFVHVYMLLFFFEAHSQTAVSKSFLLGKIDYAADTSFIKVGSLYANKTIYLNKEVYKSYRKMYDAALKDNVKLNILSGARNFNYQKNIWETKWNSAEYTKYKDPLTRAKNILKWSSIPGTSRHHWGTDIDLVSLNSSFFSTDTGKKVYDWLRNNASKYGFFQPYTAGRNSGYQEEKWHWSYVPLSKIYLAEYLKQVSCNDISGFLGAQHIIDLDVIANYVAAVNVECK